MTAAARPILDAVLAGDHRLARRVHRWRAPRWLRLWLICSSRGGDGWLWYALGAALLAAGGRRGVDAVLAAALAVSFGILVFALLKRRIGRPRPFGAAPDFHAVLPQDRFSFPSGHSITAFAVAVAVAHFFPALALGLAACAVSVAASRVLLGLHFLTDVLAGALIGALLGYGVCAVLG